MNNQSFPKELNNFGVPSLFLDLNAFEKNIQWIRQNAGEKKIRLATKSLRSKEIIKMILASSDIFQGLMTYDLREALWLREEGLKDILMGYPTVDMESLEVLTKNPDDIILMVDLPEHLHLLNRIAEKKKSYFNICIDIDLSLDLPGVRFGVFRSRVDSEKRLIEFIKTLKSCSNLKLKGLMGYEAQIAGVGDKNSFLMRSLKKISIPKLQKRRKNFVDTFIKEGFHLELINGGGTGSLKHTRMEEVVTEITVGSGFFSPGLFDHYQEFKLNPALFFTLPIVRNPKIDIFTCLGGGYIASGAMESKKLPTPYFPEGLRLLKNEGAGEVQTPLKNTLCKPLKIGDSVVMRHAKAGEICERFDKIHLVRDGKIKGYVSTYRGDGKTFC